MDKEKRLAVLSKKQKEFLKTISRFQNKIANIQDEINAIYAEIMAEVKASKETDDIFMSRNEVCAMLGISQTTLYRMRVYEQFPFHKVGSRGIKFKKSEVIEYMNEQKQK